MATSKRNGRPPGRPRGESEAINRLVLFLRAMREAAGLTVQQVHEQLTDHTVQGGSKIALSTLHRKLSGAGLIAEHRLVLAVINVCLPDEGAAMEARATAMDLLRVARQPPPVGHEKSAATHGSSDRHLDELVSLQRQLIDNQSLLLQAVQDNTRLESELAHLRSTQESSYPDLLQKLGEAEDTRDAALRSAQSAHQLVRALQDQLADLAAASQRQVSAPLRPEVVEAIDRPTAADDREVSAVRTELLRLDADGGRTAAALSSAFERLLDGAHTGRYQWQQLSKSEKASCGDIIRNQIRSEFKLDEGLSDIRIGGLDVNIIFSFSGNWMIRQDIVGQICLLIKADYATGKWGAGILRPTTDLLTRSSNNDGKQLLSRGGRAAIEWIHDDRLLSTSALDDLPVEDVSAIFAQPHGQLRIDQLFRKAQGRIIRRSDVTAVSMQTDAAKRVRETRRKLRAEGVLVLGHYGNDLTLARSLGLPVPASSEWVSVRLVRAQSDAPNETAAIELGGEFWCVAHADDQPEALPGDAA